jgi:hypothetical protein
MNENALTSLNPISQLSQSASILNQSLSPTGSMNTKSINTIGTSTQGIPIWDTEEIEVFSLMLYR